MKAREATQMNEKANETATEKAARTIVEHVTRQVDDANQTIEKFRTKVAENAWEAIRWNGESVGHAHAILDYRGLNDLFKAISREGKDAAEIVELTNVWMELAIDHLLTISGSSTCTFTNALEQNKSQQYRSTYKEMLGLLRYTNGIIAAEAS